MKYMNYSKIENQTGCGWRLHEKSCGIRGEWKEKRKSIPERERYKNRPVLTCGKFMHCMQQSNRELC
jgi:hypothetical protein